MISIPSIAVTIDKFVQSHSKEKIKFALVSPKNWEELLTCHIRDKRYVNTFVSDDMYKGTAMLMHSIPVFADRHSVKPSDDVAVFYCESNAVFSEPLSE